MKFPLRLLMPLVIFIPLLLASGIAYSQEIPTKPLPEPLQPRNTSPFEIARVVNFSKWRWDRYSEGIDVDLVPTLTKLGIDPGYFGLCGENRCEARIFRTKLSSERRNDVILKLTTMDSCRYLIFRKTERHWQLLGHIDHEFNKYEMSRHRIVRTFGKNWIV